MSLRTQPAWRALLGLVSVALLLLVPSSGAMAAPRLETIDVPSTRNFVDLTRTQLNQALALQANVLLPDGYDERPEADWPVLYLIPGVGDNMRAWMNPKKGDLLNTGRDVAAIVVMPEAGRGYLTDWWRRGVRTGTQWERYYLEELIPAIESRYRIRPGRQNHAIGGISMGAYGGLYLTGQFPSYFGSALSMSGLVDNQTLNSVVILPLDIGVPYDRIWGPPTGPYATVHNPTRTVRNLVGSRIYMSAGNGMPSSRFPFNGSAYTSGAWAEQVVRIQSRKFANAAKAAGISVTYSGHTGLHDWPYWRLEFPRVVKSDLFDPAGSVASAAQHTRWTYQTMAPRGNAWGFGYRFAEPTQRIATFSRDGSTLRGTGSGTVTITPGAADTDASGAGTKLACAFTAPLPFERTLRPGC